MTCPVNFVAYLHFIQLISQPDQKFKFKRKIERTLA